MDNFRKFHKNKHGSAVDGFLPTSGPSRPTPNFRRPNQPPVNGALGNFRQTDGFHPAQQPSLRTSAHTPLGRQPQRDLSGQIDLELPEAKPARPHTKRHVFRPVLKSLFIFVLVGLMTGGYLFGKGYLKARQIFKGGTAGAAALQENVDPAKLRGEGDGRVNILLLGKGGDGHEAPDLTDTILVASVDPLQKEAAILSIPRDFYVKTNDFGSMKINAVYATAKYQVLGEASGSDQDDRAETAGLEAIDRTVEQIIGIPIHYHVMVDFTGFKQAIDTVGGVDINVPSAVYEVMRLDGRQYVLDVQPGQQHFDGFRALAYARSRYTSPRGDFDRSERQRLMLVALKNKVLSLGTLGNPIKINQLINAFGERVQTNLGLDEIMRLYQIAGSIDSSKVASVGLADPPNNFVTTTGINGQSVVVPRAGLYNYKDIQNFVRNKLKDGFLVNENATVAVYNGTNVTGLAARTADELKSFGYNISQIADAPNKGNQQTILVDLRAGSKKYTRRYLEQRFGITAVTSMPDGSIDPGQADFVIILGQNEISRLEQ